MEEKKEEKKRGVVVWILKDRTKPTLYPFTWHKTRKFYNVYTWEHDLEVFTKKMTGKRVARNLRWTRDPRGNILVL